MKATGIVRRIDDLGRVVIPKEIRRTMHIREGDPLEIYTDSDGGVIFRKYSPLGELNNFSAHYADALYRNSGYPVVVCDRDHVIAVAGLPKKEMIERRVSPLLEDKMEQRKTFVYDATGEKLKPVEGIDRYAIVSAPIISSGDVCGSIMLVNDSDICRSDETGVKLINTAAAFLGKQMEE